jgi:O-antigen ligase
LSFAALLNAVYLLPGRTGYIVSFTVVGLILLWDLPIKWRWPALGLISLLVGTAVLFGSSSQVVSRLALVTQEAQSYAKQGVTSTSSGWRLNAWKKSIQSIQDKPLLGYGVGSWAPAVKRLDPQRAEIDFGSGNASNPHNEYLLWGVELGLLGISLFLSFILLLVFDAWRFNESIRRSLLSAIAVMAIACLFNSTLYDALIGDYVCTAIGLLLALGLHHSGNRNLISPVNRGFNIRLWISL